MTKSIPTLAAAFLMTAIATSVFAQAAIQEPGAFAFYHPNADVLGGRPAYRSFDQSNAYYVDAVPARDQRQIVPRHHRTGSMSPTVEPCPGTCRDLAPPRRRMGRMTLDSEPGRDAPLASRGKWGQRQGAGRASDGG